MKNKPNEARIDMQFMNKKDLRTTLTIRVLYDGGWGGCLRVKKENVRNKC